MAFAQMPTPRPDENVVVVIDIVAPDSPANSAAQAEFDKKFTAFKQALNDLVTNNFPGSMKMKVLLKKGHHSTINYGP